MDIQESLAKSQCGYQYIALIADWFTVLVQVVPLKHICMMDVAQALLKRWVFHNGQPKQLLSHIENRFHRGSL